VDQGILYGYKRRRDFAHSAAPLSRRKFLHWLETERHGAAGPRPHQGDVRGAAVDQQGMRPGAFSSRASSLLAARARKTCPDPSASTTSGKSKQTQLLLDPLSQEDR